MALCGDSDSAVYFLPITLAIAIEEPKKVTGQYHRSILLPAIIFCKSRAMV